MEKKNKLLEQANVDNTTMSTLIDNLTQKVSELKKLEPEFKKLQDENKKIADENEQMLNKLRTSNDNYNDYKSAIKGKDREYNNLLEKYNDTVSGMQAIIRFLLQKQNIHINVDYLNSYKTDEPLGYKEGTPDVYDESKKKYITTYKYTDILQDLIKLLGAIEDVTTKQTQLQNIKDTMDEIDKINIELIKTLKTIRGVDDVVYEPNNNNNKKITSQILINFIKNISLELKDKHEASKEIMKFAFKYIYETVEETTIDKKNVTYLDSRSFESLIELLYNDKLLLIYKDNKDVVNTLVKCYCLYTVFNQKNVVFEGVSTDYSTFMTQTNELISEMLDGMQTQSTDEDTSSGTDEKKGGAIFDKPLLIAAPIGMAGMFTAIKLRLNAVLICIFVIVLIYICYKIYKDQFKNSRPVYIAYTK